MGTTAILVLDTHTHTHTYKHTTKQSLLQGKLCKCFRKQGSLCSQPVCGYLLFCFICHCTYYNERSASHHSFGLPSKISTTTPYVHPNTLPKLAFAEDHLKKVFFNPRPYVLNTFQHRVTPSPLLWKCYEPTREGFVIHIISSLLFSPLTLFSLLLQFNSISFMAWTKHVAKEVYRRFACMYYSLHTYILNTLVSHYAGSLRMRSIPVKYYTTHCNFIQLNTVLSLSFPFSSLLFLCLIF